MELRQVWTKTDEDSERVGFSNSRSNAVHCGVQNITQLTPQEKLDPRWCPINHFGTEGRGKVFRVRDSHWFVGSSTTMRPNSIIHVGRAKLSRTHGSGRPRGREASPSQSPPLCTQVATKVFVEITDSFPAKVLPTLCDLRNVGVRQVPSTHRCRLR